jgi:hypothetical protein
VACPATQFRNSRVAGEALTSPWSPSLRPRLKPSELASATNVCRLHQDGGGLERVADHTSRSP